MNTRDHKLYRFRVQYDYVQRIPRGIDDSSLVRAHRNAQYTVLAPSKAHAELVVADEHKIYSDNLQIDFIDEIEVNAIINRETYL